MPSVPSTRWFRKLFSRRPVATVRRPLRLESLEDRVTPATINWDGGAGTLNWDDDANWVGDVEPGAADDAVIGAAFSGVTITSANTETINSVTSAASLEISAGTFTIAAASSTNNLTLSGGTLTGAGGITVNGAFSWTSGTMAGGLGGVTQLRAGGTISGGSNKILGRTLENFSGTLTYNGTNLRFGFNNSGTTEPGVLSNLVGATLSLQGDGDLGFNLGSLSHLVSNAGTVNRSGAGATTLDIPFNNNSSALIQGGTLDLNSGGTSSGTFDLSAGATLEFRGGTNTLGSGSSVTGAGSVTVTGAFTTTTVSGFFTPAMTTLSAGILNFAVSATAMTPSFAQSGGTLGGSGTLTVSTTFSWTGGDMRGGASGGKTALGTLVSASISTTANKTLGRTLENAGNLTYSGNNLLFGINSSGTIEPGVLNNLGSGTLRLVGEADLIQNEGLANQVINAGNVIHSDAGATGVGIALHNNGMVNVQEGILSLNGNSNSTGSFNVSAGTLDIGVGTHTLGSGSSVTGAGAVSVSNGTTTVSGGFSPATTILSNGVLNFTTASATTGSFTQSGGTLGGAGILTVNTAFSWTNGTMAGGSLGGKTRLLAGGSINGIVGKDLGRTLENVGGSLTYDGASLRFGVSGASGAGVTDPGVLSNLSGATLNLQNEGDLTVSVASTNHLVTNAGTLNRSGAGTTDVFVPFTNNGTLNVLSGNLDLEAGLTNYDSVTDILTGGAYIIKGTLRIPSLDIVTNRASITLDGAASALVDSASVNGLRNLATNDTSGSLTLLNDRSLTTPPLTNAGSVYIETTCALTTSAGNYTQTGGTTTVDGTLDPAGIADIQGGVLRGSGGTVRGNTISSVTGQVAPGNSPGTLNIDGNYIQNGSLAIELNGTNPGSGYDRLVVQGTVALNGVLSPTLGFTFTPGVAFIIIENDDTDPVSGTFTGLAEGAFINFPNGQRAQITYAGGTGNDVVLNGLSTAPVLDAIGNKSVNEGALLTFTATASDVDAQTLTFSLDAGAPAGASITAGGVFTWTPTEAQGPGSFPVTIRVSDGGLDDAETITITVNEVNQAPVLNAISNQTVNEGSLLSFTATASDGDLPANTLTFSLDAGAPAGAAITAGGLFSWTPTEAQGPGSFNITVRVSDGSLADTRTFSVTVNEVNQAPVLNAIGNQTVNEGATVTFTASATDADFPANTLTYSLIGAPTGATINPTTGAFSWTTTEADGQGSFGFTVRVTDNGSPSLFDEKTVLIIVNEVNQAPVLNAIANQTVNELSLLNFTAMATDGDLPANGLTFSLIGAPAGASITAGGLFSWTPTEAQGPTVVTFTVRVTDDGPGNLFDEETVQVTVNEVNQAPTLNSIPNQTVDEGTQLTFTAVGSDADVPANTLTYSLVNAPLGAMINPSTGLFTWTPMEAQGPFVFNFTVRVTDNGSPNLSADQPVQVTVNEVNQAPVLDPIGPRNILLGQTVMFTATASDPDIPANTLTFSLDAGFPTGASITAGGAFTFTPGATGTFMVTVRVTDNGSPTLSDFETVTINVAPNNNENQAPTDIALSPSSVPENSATNTVVGSLSTTDPDAGDTFAYVLVNSAGGRFKIVGSQVQVDNGSLLNFEDNTSHVIRVRSTDQGGAGLAFEKDLTVTVTNVNEAPTDINLNPSSVPENSATNTVVGNLSAIDPDASDTFVFSLVAGAGSTDNNLFTITGNQLLTAAAFNFEATPTLNIRVQARDLGGTGLTFQKALIVTVTNVNEVSTDIALNPSSVPENSATNTVVGNLSTTDPDAGESFTYVLVNSAGGRFKIVGSQVQVDNGSLLNFEDNTSHVIRVRSTDQGGTGLPFEKDLTITVTNVNEAPTDIALSPSSVAENSATNTVVGTLSTTDPDAGESFTYVLVNSAGGRFKVVGSQVQVDNGALLNFEMDTSHVIRVRSTDSGGLPIEKDLTVTVTNVNEAPTDINLVGSTVAENSAVGTVVGTLSGTDPDSGAVLSFSLFDNAGGRFTVVGNELRVAGAIDFETTPTLSVTVRASDGSLSFDEAFTITVTNVIEVLGIDVQRGATQRSYIRFLDLLFASNADANLFVNSGGSLALTRSDLNGNGPVAVGTGTQSVDGNKVSLDFGAQGIGGNRYTNAGDGYYQLGLSGPLSRTFAFYRIYGDVNGDRQVNDTDVNLIYAGLLSANSNLDINGDGVVNGLDYIGARNQRGKRLATGLVIDD